jgi:lysozyme
MKINQKGLDLVKSFEGCKLTAYQDSGGIWTIGYGTTGANVVEGLTIDQTTADKWLMDRLNQTGDEVFGYVHVPLNDNQFSALVSFAYNVGIGNFKHSTLLTLLSGGDYKSASDEFLKWDKIKGVVYPGLLRRRLAEQTLFNLSP